MRKSEIDICLCFIEWSKLYCEPYSEGNGYETFIAETSKMQWKMHVVSAISRCYFIKEILPRPSGEFLPADGTEKSTPIVLINGG